ncbi:hypothetical protein V8C42DRAFT_25235 [Trichoderma barbatum]
MDPDDSNFRPGAPNPMLGHETYDTELDQCFEDIAAGTIECPIGGNAYGAQEGDPTIDPSLLQSSYMHHTPPWAEVDVPTGHSVDTFVNSAPYETKFSQEAT